VKRIFRLHKFADLSDKKPCLISFYNLVLHPSETYESECNSAFHIQKEKLALNKGLNHAITPLDDMSALDKGLNHAITFSNGNCALNKGLNHATRLPDGILAQILGLNHAITLSNGTCAPNKGLNHATRLPDGILAQNLGLNHAFTLFDDKSIQNNDLDPTIILPKHFCAPRKGLNYATKPPNGIHAPSKDVTLGSRSLNDILSNILKEDVYCVIGLLNDILPLKSEVNHIIKLLNHFISILRMGTNTMLHITNKVMINFGKCLVLSMIQFTKPYNHVSFLNQFVSPTINHPVGGGKSVIVPYLIMSKYLSVTPATYLLETCEFKFQGHVIVSSETPVDTSDKKSIYVQIPLSELVGLILVNESYQVAFLHGISVPTRATKSKLRSLFSAHVCNELCNNYVSKFMIVSLYDVLCAQRSKQASKTKTKTKNHASSGFPPEPLSTELTHTIISKACEKMQLEKFQEAGCAICGLLTPISQLTELSQIQNYLPLLSIKGITRRERCSESEPITEHTFALDQNCKHVCNTCHISITQGRIPKHSLASGLWLGPVPFVLSSLQFVERMLIA